MSDRVFITYERVDTDEPWEQTMVYGSRESARSALEEGYTLDLDEGNVELFEYAEGIEHELARDNKAVLALGFDDRELLCVVIEAVIE